MRKICNYFEFNQIISDAQKRRELCEGEILPDNFVTIFFYSQQQMKGIKCIQQKVDAHQQYTAGIQEKIDRGIRLFHETGSN